REVVRRTAFDALKKQQRRPRLLDPEVLAALEPAWEELDGRGSRDTGAALRGCIEKLSAKARQFLADRYENDLTGQKLAERMGLTVKSAYATLTRIHRALEACVRQSLLEQEGRA